MPAACRIARLRATRATWILYPFCPRLRAGFKAALLASEATLLVDHLSDESRFSFLRSPWHGSDMA